MSDTELRVPVDALCIGCRKEDRDRQRVKRVNTDTDELEQLEDLKGTTFQDVCHHCSGVEFWNVVRVLTGLMDSEGVAEK